VTALTFDGFESFEVWPLFVEALSTSFKLLPLVVLTLPLRRLAPCSFSFSSCVLSSYCFFGGMMVE
jgi:hypothetical protein